MKKAELKHFADSIRRALAGDKSLETLRGLADKSGSTGSLPGMLAGVADPIRTKGEAPTLDEVMLADGHARAKRSALALADAVERGDIQAAIEETVMMCLLYGGDQRRSYLHECVIKPKPHPVIAGAILHEIVTAVKDGAPLIRVCKEVASRKTVQFTKHGSFYITPPESRGTAEEVEIPSASELAKLARRTGQLPTRTTGRPRAGAKKQKK